MSELEEELSTFCSRWHVVPEDLRKLLELLSEKNAIQAVATSVAPDEVGH
ncbi:MAG: hypothetical protein IPP07_07960 [Holophagales bacterium]|nr:hypothetical protein [Holophagales bacterium]